MHVTFLGPYMNPTFKFVLRVMEHEAWHEVEPSIYKDHPSRTLQIDDHNNDVKTYWALMGTKLLQERSLHKCHLYWSLCSMEEIQHDWRLPTSTTRSLRLPERVAFRTSFWCWFIACWEVARHPIGMFLSMYISPNVDSEHDSTCWCHVASASRMIRLPIRWLPESTGIESKGVPGRFSSKPPVAKQDKHVSLILHFDKRRCIR
jgi:hypothetical protein